MTLYINNKPVNATHFAYDGCHKVYLIFNATDFADAVDCGYDSRDIYPVSRLPEIWEQSCVLRFIYSIDLNATYVSQFDDGEADVEWRE